MRSAKQPGKINTIGARKAKLLAKAKEAAKAAQRARLAAESAKNKRDRGSARSVAKRQDHLAYCLTEIAKNIGG